MARARSPLLWAAIASTRKGTETVKDFGQTGAGGRERGQRGVGSASLPSERQAQPEEGARRAGGRARKEVVGGVPVVTSQGSLVRERGVGVVEEKSAGDGGGVRKDGLHPTSFQPTVVVGVGLPVPLPLSLSLSLSLCPPPAALPPPPLFLPLSSPHPLSPRSVSSLSRARALCPASQLSRLPPNFSRDRCMHRGASAQERAQPLFG